MLENQGVKVSPDKKKMRGQYNSFIRDIEVSITNRGEPPRTKSRVERDNRGEKRNIFYTSGSVSPLVDTVKKGQNPRDGWTTG